MTPGDQSEEPQTRALPAWSSQFSPESLREIAALGPIGEIDRQWAWGGSRGEGVRVAVIDSGIEHDHPAIEGCVHGGTVVEVEEQASGKVRYVDDDPPTDIFGHGTACAAIIHAIAPAAELYSVRVIGRDLTGKALQFAGGIRWAIDQGMSIANMSLSTSRSEYYGLFHELADEAYFRNVMLVSAVNNIPAPSYPSLYSSVVSVAAHNGHDPFTYYYNPSPPVEFGAPGIDVEVAWLNKSTSVSTGNSFAAPHIAGIIALIRAKHPELTPFQVKTVLLACAANTRPSAGSPAT